MNAAPLRHLPRKIKFEYTETMCGKTICDFSLICHDPARVTCRECFDEHISEAYREQDRFYESGHWLM